MSKIVPTPKQLEWADLEIGVIIHYDIQVFEPSYKFRKCWGYHPDPTVFNPTELNTDNWIETAKNAGAKYAILVAKHCTGFSLWPTEAHEYSVANSSYKGDIVGEFIASCKKYGIKPGLYYSTGCNAYLNVDAGHERSGDPKKNKDYYAIVEKQIREIWSNYGGLFELWFDGGIVAKKDGGIELKPLYDELQPNAIKFQGSAISDVNNLRWIGNEVGVAPIDSYCTVTLNSQYDGIVEDKRIGVGSIDGNRWSPAECDMPNRRKQWFYRKGEERLVIPVRKLEKKYMYSVGRNCNLLLGMVIDDRGLVPEKDAGVFKEFGDKIRSNYAKVLAKAQGNAERLVIDYPIINAKYLVISEDLTNGHTVDGFTVRGVIKGRSHELMKAKVIGHKRIVDLKGKDYDNITLYINNSVGAIANIKMTVY